jgi:hypothetical protein
MTKVVNSLFKKFYKQNDPPSDEANFEMINVLKNQCLPDLFSRQSLERNGTFRERIDKSTARIRKARNKKARSLRGFLGSFSADLWFG